MGKCDPQIIVYGNELVFGKNKKEQELQDDEINWIELGRTEFQTEQINPKFKKKIKVHYKYNSKKQTFNNLEIQDMKFVVIDYDKNLSLQEQEIIGELRCTLSEILGASGSKLTAGLVNPLKYNRKNGYLSIQGEELEVRMLCFCCWPLYKKIEAPKQDE